MWLGGDIIKNIEKWPNFLIFKNMFGQDQKYMQFWQFCSKLYAFWFKIKQKFKNKCFGPHGGFFLEG